MITCSEECIHRGGTTTLLSDLAAKGGHEKQGKPLGWKGVCRFIKYVFLAEHCHSSGLPGLADSLSPCPFCYASPDDLHTFSGLSAFGTHWPVKRPANFEEAARACEVRVTLGRDDRTRVRAALADGKTKGEQRASLTAGL